MQDDSSTAADNWIEAITLEQLQAKGQVATKVRGQHIALLIHAGAVHACNNRCPHQGYPLSDGVLDSEGMLTCQWHNWKFDLRSGANVFGGDALRTYPVRVQDGRVWVDMREPPPDKRAAQALGRIDEAMHDHDYARIARELARLSRTGVRPDVALLRAIVDSHARLRYGMTHAYAAADAWFRLRDIRTDEVGRLACATEALAYISMDTLRESLYPYTVAQRPWHPPVFLDAVEGQDETTAVACLNGALADGLGFEVIEPTLAEAALAHYNDFGHALIYLTHVRHLVARLGPASVQPLLAAWTRSLVLATREDLLPDFKAYVATLPQWPSAMQPGDPAPPSGALFEAQSISQTLSVTVAAARQHPPLWVLQGLMDAAARHLLRFDESLALRTDGQPADDVGWLDFSHGLTFGHAVRQVCQRRPALWPRGLLQLALFVGRNTPHLTPGLDSAAAQAAWKVDDDEAFDQTCQDSLLDHGSGLDIYAAHRLKTWMAVRDTIAMGTAPAVASSLRAAVRRLLSVRFKQRHSLRTARQAVEFVARE